MSDALKPTEAELEILHVLWAQGPRSVREVNAVLNQQREVGYTTTLKIMQIMMDKGLLTRNAEQRTHIYAAAVREAEVQQTMLRRFVDTAFKGSAMKLVMQALGDHQASKSELEAIKALIDSLEEEGQAPPKED